MTIYLDNWFNLSTIPCQMYHIPYLSVFVVFQKSSDRNKWHLTSWSRVDVINTCYVFKILWFFVTSELFQVHLLLSHFPSFRLIIFCHRFRDSIMCDTRTRKRYAKRTRYTWELLLVSTATCNHTIAWYVFHVSILFQVHVFQFIKNVFEFHLIEFIVCDRHTFNVQRTDICSTRELEKSTHKPE